MTLGDLLRDVAQSAPFDSSMAERISPREAAAHVGAVTYDSRLVTAGSVFVALRGLQADGATFARDAVARGAIAVVAEDAAPAGVGVIWLQVSDARLALAALAAAFY
ncbi:MAG: Mur ligase domain-containing protein, partial [Dehalococcoidia bacterium]